ncbi:MAG: hypothetical protein ACI3YY_00310 [Candidatus Cryptobacteroides sp.]
MKIRFSKVATLFLAGAAVLAAGCTDYQSDINDIYVKIDELASKESVASLQSQVVVLSNALDALKSDHSKDITALQSSIDALKNADAQFTSQIAVLDGKIGENAKDIASLQTSLSKTDETVAKLSSAFESYKNQVNTELSNLKSKDTELGEKIQAAETALRAEISALSSKVDEEIKNRKDADKVLGDKLDAAIKEAADNLSAAEARLNEKLATESTRAQLAEQALQSAIDAEAEARAAGDNKLAAELAKEVERAKQAEADINAALTAEIERAKLAEKALEDAIAAEAKTREAADLLEAATREAADEKLQESIDALEAALAAEIKRAAEVENALKVELHNTTLELDAAIKAEAAARAAADKKTADALQSEIDRAKKAEDVLNRTIEAEKERASRTEELLNTAIADVRDALNSESDRAQKAEKVLEADLAAEEAARLLADTRLDNLLKDELFARETADAQLAAAIAAESERAENAESALQLALEAEAVARQKEDKVLQAVAEGIDNRLVSLQKDYNTFKSDVYAIIGGLSQRISANNAAISNINNVTIPAIYAQIAKLQEADSLLRVDMENGDQFVLDSLNVVKAAMDNTIANIKASIADIVAVNKDQSDSLKLAFESFVLKDDFLEYQSKVTAALDAKADTAAVNAAIKKLDDHNNRIIALEAYKTHLEENVMPFIDSLRAADLIDRMDVAESLLDEHDNAIKGLQGWINETLKPWMDNVNENIQSLLSRIRSVEFVPDYTDKYITIEQVIMPVVGDVPSNDGDDFYWHELDTVFVFNAPSYITYKVYPTEMADSLVKYFKAHKNDGAVYFDVVNVKGSGARFDATDDVKRPELEILDVNSSDRTAGAITFKVKAKNVDDFGKLTDFIYRRFNHSIGNNALIPDKIAFFGNLIGMIQNIPHFPEEEENPVKDFNPFLSSALVIEGVDGGDITSEYNIWTPGVTGLINSPEFGYPDDNSPYGVATPYELSQDVEYTDTEVYSIADSVDLYALVSLRGEQEKYMKFAEATEDLGVDVTPDFAALRYYDCEHNQLKAHKVVFTENPVPSYGWTPDSSAFTPATDVFTKLKSQLDPTSKIAVRKAAIGDVEDIYYSAIINGVEVDYLDTYFNITKTKALAVVDTIKINWEYLKDVDVDAAIFNMGGETATGVYSRTGIVLSIDEEASNLNGVTSADFINASSKLISYTVKDKDGKVVAYYDEELEKLVEELVIKLEINASRQIVASIRNFKWGETYTISAVYDLDDAEVTVSGVINTIDRPRTPITLNYGTYTTEYKKDMDFMVRACMTFGNGQGYHTPTHENFTTSPIDVRDSIAHLYGESAKVPANLAADLWKNGKDKAFVVSTEEEDFYVDDPCVNKLYRVLYSDYKKAGAVVEYPDVEFYTYYGQKIIVKAKSTVTAPKYDFRHNIFRVFDNGTTEAESHPTSDVKVSGRFYSNVEPAYTADKWNGFSKFDVAAINLPEAFVVVNDTLGRVSAAEQDNAGLKVSFELEEVPACQNDGRDNTYITIEDNMLKYHGWDEKVAVYGSMAIVNTDGSEFKFPTSFDKGFKAIYADKLGEGEPTEGRYADYEVVKFNPLHDFKSTKDVTLQVFDAKMYTTNVLANLSLLDQRKEDQNDPTMPTSVTGIENGVELFDGGNWKVGTGANLFALGVKANEAYDIESDFKKVISDDVHEDIKNAVELRNEKENGAVVFEFNYTQQIVLTQPVLVKVNAELTQPWAEKPLTATVNVTITK